MVDLHNPAECWYCGRRAGAESTQGVKLVAAARRRLDGLGHSVKRGRWSDSVVVHIPRCVACQWRSYAAFALFFACLPGGTFGLPALLPTLHVARSEVLQAVLAFFGMLLGMGVAMIGVALLAKMTVTRATNAYPPIAKLLDVGWDSETEG